MTEHTTNEIPYGYCHCGCGQQTKISTKNRREAGWVKGEPLRYVSGHQGVTRHLVDEPNPSGLCMCGCGEPTPLAERTSVKLGYVAGKPIRYLPGHQFQATRSRPVEVRFWEKIDKRGPNECWPWLAASDQHGYGTFWDGERLVKAHRYSYKLANDFCPDEFDCLHKCDNPPCCNPKHLFLGTAKDNVDDMLAKGRFNLIEGEEVGNASLTNEQAREFRRQFAESNRSVAAFAAFHDVPYMIMWNLLQRKTYKNV